MSTKLYVDFESVSDLDLKSVGAHRYVKSPHTDMLCLAFAFDEEEPEVIGRGELPARLYDHVSAGKTVCAHNINFDALIWSVCERRYGYPALKVAQLDDSMARCYAMSIPGSLANAAAAVGIDAKKDPAGYRKMIKYCQPRNVHPDGTIEWWDDPEELIEIYSYAAQDIRVLRLLDKRLLPLSPQEKKVWELDYAINQRGVYVDLPAVRQAMLVVESEQKRLNEELQEVTDHQVATFNSNAQFKKWIAHEGIETEGIAKDDVTRMLNRADLPDRVRAALTIRQEAAKSSTSKLKAFSSRTSADQRVRGIFQYHGANTGRFAGRGIQPQNMKRSDLSPEEVDDILSHLDPGYLSLTYGAPMSVIADCMRGFLTAAPGMTLMAADFNAIEARVLAWLAGEFSVLEIFRRGGDIYKVIAAEIFNVPLHEVTKAQRQVGKVAILALGYQGGVHAFQSMAKGYGVTLSPVADHLWRKSPIKRRKTALWGWEQRGKTSGIDKKEFIACDLVKLAYRESNPHIVQYWRDIEATAIAAVKHPGQKCICRNVSYQVRGSFLVCTLPSGRRMIYAYPILKEQKTPWGETREMLGYKAEDSQTRKWERHTAYGGLLVENITQAVARDVLVDAMLRVESAGLPIVLHVHDEIVVETPDASRMADFISLVERVPSWARGLPITAEGWNGKRYRKA